MSGLLGWWPLHETEGERAYNLAGNTYGDVNGAIQGVSGRGGLTAYSFNGDNDYVKISSSSETHGNLPAAGDGLPVTFSVWCRESIDGGGRIYSEAQEGTNNILSISTNSVYIRDSSAGGTTVDIEEDLQGEWHHIAGIFTDSLLIAYVDGELVGSTVNDRDPSVDNSYIGKLEYTQTLSHFDGEICDVRIYDRVLSPSEVRELYIHGSSDLHKKSLSDGSDAGAVSRWKLEDGGADGSTAQDRWGNNDGNIEGASFTDNSVRNEERALRFDGESDYNRVSDSESLNFSQEFSISLWAKMNEAGGYISPNQYFIAKYGEGSWDGTHSYAFYIANSDGGHEEDYISLTLWDEEGNEHHTARDFVPKLALVNLDPQSWYHFVAVWTGEKIKIYRNGVLVSNATTTFDGSLNQTEGGLYMGQLGNDTRYYNGLLDNISVFDRALESWEVLELYRWGSLGKDMRKELVNKKGGGQ